MRSLRVFLFPILLGLLSSSAAAADLTVDCDADPLPPGVLGNITDAINATTQPGFNTITVTGTCTEVVRLGQGMTNITIEAPAGQTATIERPAGVNNQTVIINGATNIVLRRLLITSGSVVVQNGASATFQGVTVQGLSNLGGIIVLENSLLSAGGTSSDQGVTVSGAATGITSTGSVLVLGPRLTLENNGSGLAASGSRVTIRSANTLATANYIRNNTFNGATFNIGATVNFIGANFIEGNGASGLTVDASVVQFNSSTFSDGTPAATTIQNNFRSGAGFIFGSQGLFGGNGHVVRNNGNPTEVFRAGLSASHNSTLRTNGVAITDNIGPGIALDHSATARLFTTTVTGNSEEGIRVLAGSIAELPNAFPDGSPTSNTISGNAKSDLVCDGTSHATGSLNGTTYLTCKAFKK